MEGLTIPNSAELDEVTIADVTRASNRFMNSPLGSELLRLGVDLEEQTVRTNFNRLTRITSQAWKPSEDFNLTLMGRELLEGQTGQANRGRRIVVKQFEEYLDLCKTHFPTWHYWQGEKEYNKSFVSKAAVDPMPMAETLSWYNAKVPLGDVTTSGVARFREACTGVFQNLQKHMQGAVEIKISQPDEWMGKMNWNRNSGHPYWMPISEERYNTVDWPAFKQNLFNIVASVDRSQMEEMALKPPPSVPNANKIVYGMFMRPPDRVIHASELYWKGPGAVATANLTPNLRTSEIAWSSIPELASRFGAALVDAEVVVAEDIKKFDRSIPKVLMTEMYEAFWDSDFLSNMPEFRNIIGSLLYILTKDGHLQLTATHKMMLRQGLPSGHPLTQFVGSVIHLTFYEWWKHDYNWNPTLEAVLSDDGISVHKDIGLDEMEKFIFGEAHDTFKSVGMVLHPDKTKLCDPIPRTYVGQLMGEEINHHDMTFFLKRNFQVQHYASFGNPAGALDSFLQTERPASDEFQEVIDKYIVASDQIRFGGQTPKALYDIARVVDIIASAGVGNPLIDDYIAYVQRTWPGFEKRGVKYLTELLDPAWRNGTTRYAGGTLDSGINRLPVVEALLDLEGKTTFWDERVFSNGGI